MPLLYYFLSRILLSLLYSISQVYAQSGLYDNHTSTLVSSSTFKTGCNSTLHNCSSTYGGCEVQAATLQVLFFPPVSQGLNDSTSVTTRATTVVSDGYTFTSPSIYLVFDTLAAVATIFYSYPPYETATNIGAVYHDVTRAYPPGYITTLPQGCYHGFGASSALNVEDYINPPQNWQVLDRCDMYFSDQVQDNFGGPNGTLMALSPLISLPADISTYDPAWKDCYGGGPYDGSWDPPRVLSPVSALMDSTTVLEPTLAPSAAKPQAQPSSPQATPTLNPDFWPTIRSQIIGHSKTAEAGHPTHAVHPKPGAHESSKSTVPALSVSELEYESANNVLRLTSAADPLKTDPADPTAAVADTGNPDPRLHSLPYEQPIATIHEHTVFRLGNGDVAFDGNTLKVGDPAISIDATPFSVGSSAVHFGHSSYRYKDPVSHQPAGLDPIGGHVLHTLTEGGVAIGSYTIKPGEVTTIGGTRLSMGPGNMFFGSRTYAIHNLGVTNEASSFSESDSELFSKLQDGNIAIGHLTMFVGEATTISGMPVSVGSNIMVWDDNTYPLPTRTQAAHFFVGDSFQTLSDGGILFGGATLLPGSQSTISRTAVSVGNGFVVIGGSTHMLPEATRNPNVFDGDSIRTRSGGAVVFDGMTLSPDTQTTISGVRVSIGSGDIVVNGVTQTISREPPSVTFGLGAMIDSMFGFDPHSADAQISADAAMLSTTSSEVNGDNIASATSTLTSSMIGPTAEAFTSPAFWVNVNVWILAAGLLICAGSMG